MYDQTCLMCSTNGNPIQLHSTQGQGKRLGLRRPVREGDRTEKVGGERTGAGRRGIRESGEGRGRVGPAEG